MTLRLALTCAAFGALALISSPLAAQQRGQLTVKYALDGHTETYVPDKFFGPEIKTPRKREPYLWAAWRRDPAPPRPPDFLAQFNAYQDDPKRFGLGLLLERNGKSLHYASRCSPNVMPKCDPTSQGLRHDAAGKKIVVKDAVFVRVSLKDVDPKDTITVNGELSYGN